MDLKRDSIVYFVLLGWLGEESHIYISISMRSFKISDLRRPAFGLTTMFMSPLLNFGPNFEQSPMFVVGEV